MQKISSLYKEQFDIIFMDPPYNKNLEKLALEYLKDASFVSKNTLIIIEMDKKSDTNWIFSLGFELIKEKVYKTNKHIFVRRI